jgi:hypothetical protein
MAIDRAMDLTGAAAREASKRQAHCFYAGMALACAVTVFSGFAPTFYLRSSSLPPLAPSVIAHGVAMTGWVLLFLAQSLLAAAGRIRWHRWLGAAGAVLAVIIVASGVPLALSGARRGIFAGDSLAFLLVILVDLLMFSVFTAAGLYSRRRKGCHRTFMLLAMISLLPPAIFRWPIAGAYPAIIPAVVLIFVAVVVAHDWRSEHSRAASLWGGLGLTLSIPLRFALAQSAAWHTVANWLVRHSTV